MVEKQHPGRASVGVGTLVLALGVICIVLTFLRIIPNQTLVFSWINNYVIGGVGIIIGLLLVRYGIYTRNLVQTYIKKVETVTKESAEQAEKLRQTTIALKESEREIGRKKASLQIARAKLRATRKLAERKTEQMYKVRGKLGERSKRLKQIARIAKVKKKE